MEKSTSQQQFPVFGAVYSDSLTYSRTMSSKNPEKSLQRSESHLFTSTAKETNRKLLRPSTKTKRMPFLKQENLATPIQLRFTENCVVVFIPTLRFPARDNISQAIRYCLLPLQFLQVHTKDPSVGAHNFRIFYGNLKIVQKASKCYRER